MCGKPKKGKRAMRRQWRRKRARFEEGSRFSGAKRTETGWADGVFLHHAGRKDFFDTLKIGAPYHRRGAGACEEVPWKRRSDHGGWGRFVARGRTSDGEKFFSAEGGTRGKWAETLSLQGVQGLSAQREAIQKCGGVLGRADCSCEADEIMLT